MTARLCILTLVLAGCGSDTELPDADRAMISDGLSSIAHDSAAIDQLELTFSPSFAYQPMGPDGDVSQASKGAIDAAKASAKARLGASCVNATDLPVVPENPTDRTTVFELRNCVLDGQPFVGTVTSHWSLVDGCLSVTHTSGGLMIGGSPVAVTLSVSGCVADSTESRQRELSSSAEGVQVTGAWFAAYDLTTGCGTRSGTSTTTFSGGNGIQQTETGMSWCGAADQLTPLTVDALDDGTLEIERLGRRVVARFTGDGEIDVLTSRGDRVSTTVD